MRGHAGDIKPTIPISSWKLNRKMLAKALTESALTKTRAKKERTSDLAEAIFTIRSSVSRIF